MEQCIERQANLYVNLVGFEKAFDSLDNETLWKLVGYNGLPYKIINLIKNMYKDFSGHVICRGKLSDTFVNTTGVWQDCLFSPLIFLVANDWIMRRTTENQQTKIQRTLFTQLKDLHFANDQTAVSEKPHTHAADDRLTTG